MEFLVRLVTHRQVQPGLFIYNTFIMGEGVKTGLSMISAHTAFAKSAEAHLCGGQLNDSIVDASSAEAAAGSNFFCC